MDGVGPSRWPVEPGRHEFLAVGEGDRYAGEGAVRDECSRLELHGRVHKERPHGVAVGRGSGVEGAMAAD